MEGEGTASVAAQINPASDARSMEPSVLAPPRNTPEIGMTTENLDLRSAVELQIARPAEVPNIHPIPEEQEKLQNSGLVVVAEEAPTWLGSEAAQPDCSAVQLAQEITHFGSNLNGLNATEQFDEKHIAVSTCLVEMPVGEARPPQGEFAHLDSLSASADVSRGPGRPRKRSLTSSDSPAGSKRAGPGRPPSSARKSTGAVEPPLHMTTRFRDSTEFIVAGMPIGFPPIRIPAKVEVDIGIPDVRPIDESEDAALWEELRLSGALSKRRTPKRRPLASCAAEQRRSPSTKDIKPPKIEDDVVVQIDDAEDGADPLVIAPSEQRDATVVSLEDPQRPPSSAPDSAGVVMEEIKPPTQNVQISSPPPTSHPSEVPPGLATEASNGECDAMDVDSEDTDDECFALRHFRSEMEERVRWDKLSKEPKFSDTDMKLTDEEFVDSKWWKTYFAHATPQRPTEEEWAKWDEEMAEKKRAAAKKLRAKEKKRLSTPNKFSIDATSFISSEDLPLDLIYPAGSSSSSKKRKRASLGDKMMTAGWTSVSLSMSDEGSEDVNIDSLDGDASYPAYSSAPSNAVPPSEPCVTGPPSFPHRITFKIAARPVTSVGTAALALNTSAPAPAPAPAPASLPPPPAARFRNRTSSAPSPAASRGNNSAVAVRNRKGGVMTRGRSRRPLTEAEKRELDAENRVWRAIESTFVWLPVPPPTDTNVTVQPRKNIIRLRRYNVAEVHSHDFLLTPVPTPTPAPPAEPPQPTQAIENTVLEAPQSVSHLHGDDVVEERSNLPPPAVEISTSLELSSAMSAPHEPALIVPDGAINVQDAVGEAAVGDDRPGVFAVAL